MAKQPEQQGLTLGFEGGGSLAVTLSSEALAQLTEQLPNGGWYSVQLEDGQLQVDLKRVVYLRTDVQEQRVGFSLS